MCAMLSKVHFAGGTRIRHGRILGRQTECVPTHGLQHVPAVHAHESREHIADGVIAHVPHVQAAARIGKHGQAIILLAAPSSLASKQRCSSQYCCASASTAAGSYLSCMVEHQNTRRCAGFRELKLTRINACAPQFLRRPRARHLERLPVVPGRARRSIWPASPGSPRCPCSSPWIGRRPSAGHCFSAGGPESSRPAAASIG